MSGFQPVAIYGLEVPPGGILIPAAQDFPAHFRITMAAIDPTEAPEADDNGDIPVNGRSTLKLLKSRMTDLGLDDDDEDDEDEAMKALVAAYEDDEDEDEDDEDVENEPNGGPSNPSKKQTMTTASIAKLLKATKDAEDSEDDSDEEMADPKPNGVKPSKKGKEKAVGLDDDDEDEDDEDEISFDLPDDLEEFVICTLDNARNYQQPIDIHVGEGESVYFRVDGAHSIHLTGNYLVSDVSDDEYDSEDDEDYDLSPDELEYALADGASEDESDELDELADPARVTELADSGSESDEVEAPALVSTSKKGKNKRPAEDPAEGLDDLISSSKADPPKLSKKQAKKQKNNKGEPVAASEPKSGQKNGAANKADKKVQFAQELEQGPTPSAQEKKDSKVSLGKKTVQGVTIDDRTLGTGRAVKNGDNVGMRYIGKLTNGKVFDANKKGKPFYFKVGKGEVIKGWDIGIVGMTIGGERRLTIPSKLAYGSKSMPGIPANSDLQFDVKLLEIK